MKEILEVMEESKKFFIYHKPKYKSCDCDKKRKPSKAKIYTKEEILRYIQQQI
ncbi:MAG: hypothetical protein BWY04_00473 [candidate division CPR1 bacterium ADurb.Bin160]|uniref:Uncharacterized protein n=1 Tax=candidate division CPR1 bacterium ADurb.Bin160 TaxID=1852826 RepID=A0A1V5ZP32_9BACT|nr:MAG: hypothetical protein BWY04_00473 [candidate division CPR1 bacterium ADurb.Bin160]